MENVIVFVIVAGAVLFMIRSLVGTFKGKGGCACGDGCPSCSAGNGCTPDDLMKKP